LDRRGASSHRAHRLCGPGALELGHDHLGFAGVGFLAYLTNEALSVCYAEILWLRRAIKDITLSNQKVRLAYG
jgi:hypothetical protein